MIPYQATIHPLYFRMVKLTKGMMLLHLFLRSLSLIVDSQTQVLLPWQSQVRPIKKYPIPTYSLRQDHCHHNIIHISLQCKYYIRWDISSLFKQQMPLNHVFYMMIKSFHNEILQPILDHIYKIARLHSLNSDDIRSKKI